MSREVHFGHLFDEGIQGEAQSGAAAVENAGRVNGAVHRGGTGEILFSRDPGWAAPAQVVLLNFLALWVMADGTFTLVAAQGCGAFLLYRSWACQQLRRCGLVCGHVRGCGRGGAAGDTGAAELWPGWGFVDAGDGAFRNVLHVSSSRGVKSAPTDANRFAREKIFVEIRSR